MVDWGVKCEAALPRTRVAVAILGAGPAGCATALTLRRYVPGLTVAIVSRPEVAPVGTPLVGETVSPGVLPLLHYLGLRDEFQGLGHLRCGGTASAWGSPIVQERSYLFSAQGSGWHLDRAAFDAWLRSRAESAGAVGLRSPITAATRVDGLWHIVLADDAELQADVIVEATGRTAWLLRQHDDPPVRGDALVAEARWFRHDHAEVSSDGALIEAGPDGWWYSATLPGLRGVAMFMTDRDLRTTASWDDRLAACPATLSRLASWQGTDETVARAAHSQCASIAAGDGWVAAGDSAAAFDPISSLGIGFSLRSGMEAARVAVALVEGQTGIAEEYTRSLHRIYADYRQRLTAIYAQETRWSQREFWRRRTTGCRA